MSGAQILDDEGGLVVVDPGISALCVVHSGCIRSEQDGPVRVDGWMDGPDRESPFETETLTGILLARLWGGTAWPCILLVHCVTGEFGGEE